MSLRMQAFDVHVAIICMALNSCKKQMSDLQPLVFPVHHEKGRRENSSTLVYVQWINDNKSSTGLRLGAVGSSSGYPTAIKAATS